MADELMPFPDAVDAVRSRLNASVGRAQTLLRTACASGEVRSFAWPYLLVVPRSLWEAEPSAIQRVTEDGVFVHWEEYGFVEISQDDLMDWLDRAGGPIEGAGDDPRSAYRTGAAGRPTPIQLVEAELDRLIASLGHGEFLGKSIVDVAQSLSRWLNDNHPAAPRLTPKSISNNLRNKIRPYVGARN